MKNAAIYLRVSTTDQNYERQEVELKALAQALGYNVSHIFEEKKSAVLKMDTREELTKMRKLTSADVDRIFIWDITRLSRRAIDFINLINEFTEKGICIYFKDKEIRTLDDNGEQNMFTSMYLYILGLFAQMDAENLKAKMLSGKESALLKGNSYTSNAPFGYYIKDKHLFVKEDEAIYVKQAFEQYNEGKDLQYITDLFNANRVPLKSKKTNIVWVKGTISQLLANSVYYGKGKRVLNAKKPEIVTRYFDAPAIISKELYDSCRKKASENANVQDKSKKIVSLLRGLLVCGLCDKYYVMGSNKHRDYRDGDIRANVNKRLGCKNGSIKGDIADDLVWNVIKGIYEYKTFREKSVIEKEKSKELIKKNQENISQLQKEISSLDNKYSRLSSAYLKELYTDDEFAKEKQSIAEDKARVEKIISELESSNLLLNDIINSEFDYSQLQTRNLSREEKKQVCNELIKVVRIYNYGHYKRLLHIELKVGLSFNLLTNMVGYVKDYIVLDDDIVTFNNPFKSPEEVRSRISDFTVTNNNNELFNEEVFGEYSFIEIWEICKKYNLVKKY